MKQYNGISILLGIVLFVVGFMVGQVVDLDAGVPEVAVGMTDFSLKDEPNNTGANTVATDNGGVAVDSNALTDGQRQMLSSMGIDADSITITDEMIACAEAKVGSARLTEFKNGATPSFTEGAQLMACYTAG